MCQSAFKEFTANRFGVDKMNPVPNMTPYRTGYPVDSIQSSSDQDPDLNRRTKVYQQIVGSINWPAQCTHPGVAPVLTFLSVYNLAPNHQNYKATHPRTEATRVPWNKERKKLKLSCNGETTNSAEIWRKDDELLAPSFIKNTWIITSFIILG